MIKHYELVIANDEQFLITMTESSNEISDINELHKEYELFASYAVMKTDIPARKVDKVCRGLAIELVALDINDGYVMTEITYLGEWG